MSVVASLITFDVIYEEQIWPSKPLSVGWNYKSKKHIKGTGGEGIKIDKWVSACVEG